MKLSEQLAQLGAVDEDGQWARYAIEARALEERVAELKACNQVARHYADGVEIKLQEAQDDHHAATARAEAAEAEAENLRNSQASWDRIVESREVISTLEADVARLREDVALAAGELLVPFPEAGTDMARMLIANRLMRNERDALRTKLEKVREAIRVPTYNSHEKAYDAAYAALTDAESILDGEGDA